MTDSEFQKIKHETFKRCSWLLAKKKVEYTRNEADRLEAFKLGAKIASTITPTTPEEVCLDYQRKHLVSIQDMVADLVNDNIVFLPTRTQLDEKIDDAINYFVLLKALFVERIYLQELKGERSNRTPNNQPTIDELNEESIKQPKTSNN